MWKYIVIYSVILLLTDLYAPYCGAVLLDRVVAKVNDDIILWTELVTAMKQYNISPDSSDARVREKEILNELIDRKLQIQQARRLGYKAALSEIKRAIDDIKSKYNLSQKDFEESLKAEGLTYEDYKAQIREKLLLTKVVNGEINSKLIITDEDMRTSYEENQKRYEMTSQVHIRQIFFNDPLDAHKREKLTMKAENIYQRIQNGEDLAKLAEEFSEDSTRYLGGDIGFVKRSDLLAEVAEVAFSLDEGQVSKPFWSTKGLHIIKVEEKKVNTTSDGINEETEKMLRKELYQKHYNKWIRKLRKNAFIEISL
jgi:peptidyl-prolyl cis-trans isomerase SurA